MYNFRSLSFMMSAPDRSFLPADEGFEIAFVGRSNAGKSSALNALAEQKQLARTSKTPGRTQMINLFRLDDSRRLVDLPGYGYAKVPLAVKKQWQKALNEYLETRKCLRGLVVVMDIRTPLTSLDRQIVDWAISCRLKTLLLLTKADKLNQGPRAKVVREVNFALEEFQGHEDYVQVVPFSSVNLSIGLKNLREILSNWLDSGSGDPEESTQDPSPESPEEAMEG
jgi:GTP-binding protein